MTAANLPAAAREYPVPLLWELFVHRLGLTLPALCGLKSEINRRSCWAIARTHYYFPKI